MSSARIAALNLNVTAHLLSNTRAAGVKCRSCRVQGTRLKGVERNEKGSLNSSEKDADNRQETRSGKSCDSVMEKRIFRDIPSRFSIQMYMFRAESEKGNLLENETCFVDL